MKWVIAAAWAALLVVIIAFAVPSVRSNISALLSYSECDTPLAYKLGSVDARFNLSRAEAIENMQDAGNIWSEARGQNLFSYSPDAKLTVSFVYDQRQALNNKINALNDQVSQKNEQLKQQINQYKTDSANFEKKLNDFMNTVGKYNREGGAPEEVYNDLLKQQDQLKAEAESLNIRARELNLSTRDYNSDVSVLNSDINQFKEELKVKPEEGLYDGSNNTITIYFVDNHNELIHTLAHEFGHARGMTHVDNKNSIMFPNTTGSLIPTAEDLVQLEYVCRKQSAPLHLLRQIHEWIYDQSKGLRESLSA